MRHRSGLLALGAGVVWVASVVASADHDADDHDVAGDRAADHDAAAVVHDDDVDDDHDHDVAGDRHSDDGEVHDHDPAGDRHPVDHDTVPPTVAPTGPPNIAISTTTDAPDVTAELPEDFPGRVR